MSYLQSKRLIIAEDFQFHHGEGGKINEAGFDYIDASEQLPLAGRSNEARQKKLFMDSYAKQFERGEKLLSENDLTTISGLHLKLF